MIKKFNVKDIDAFIRGDQEKGTFSEIDTKGNKKTYYIKTETSVHNENSIPKIHLNKYKNPYSNLILYECVTSKIFQKLGINTVPYHFGRIIDPNNQMAWIPAVYSKSFVEENESQFTLESLFQYDYVNGKKINTISPSKLLSGKKIISMDDYDFSIQTYVDENLYLIKNFVDSIKSNYSGGVYINYDEMKAQMVMQVIGDLLCYNKDRHPQNIIFISQVNPSSYGKSCSIRLAPAFDFGLAFFSRRNQKHFYEEIVQKGIPYIMNDKDIRFISLTDGAQKNIFEEFDLTQDYLLLLKEKKNLTPGEEKVKRLIKNLIRLNIKDCIKEVFVEELDGAQASMNTEELICLYNKQMKKDIDIHTIENVEKLFNYSRYFLLHQNPLRKRSFKSYFIDERTSSDISPLIDNKQELPVLTNSSCEKKQHISNRAMGDE